MQEKDGSLSTHHLRPPDVFSSRHRHHHLGLRHGVVGRDGAHVLNDLAVAGPHKADGLRGPDAGAARVSSRAKPGHQWGNARAKAPYHRKSRGGTNIRWSSTQIIVTMHFVVIHRTDHTAALEETDGNQRSSSESSNRVYGANINPKSGP